MYTNCPECGTVFRISINELRVAEGFVRCGHCAATFSAIATLTDELPPTVIQEQLASPTDTAPEPAPEPEPPEAPEAAATYVPLPISEDTLEFDIPEDSWSRFFEGKVSAEHGAARAEAEAETDEPPPAAAPASPSIPPDVGVDVGTGIGSDTVDQAGLYRALAAESGDPATDQENDWESLLAEVDEDDDAPEAVYVISDEPPATPPAATAEEASPEPEVAAIAWDDPPDTGSQTGAPAPLPADFAADFPRGGEALSAPVVPPLPAALPDAELLAGDRPFLWKPPAAKADGKSWRHRAYTAGTAALALLLVIQVLHLQRDELATNPTLSGPMQRSYAALGLTLWPAWDLRAYQVRNSEAVADRSSPGALDILARIAVVGDDRVGLPFVRVTLRDGLARPLGTRVFEPAEYLGKNSRPHEPVSPGTLIPVEISLKDPGRDALGFDVDVCVMNQHEGMICRADREPFAR